MDTGKYCGYYTGKCISYHAVLVSSFPSLGGKSLSSASKKWGFKVIYILVMFSVTRLVEKVKNIDQFQDS